ncbi:MAG TPA: GspMb/PilO family protein [Candidatus Saccharibacteria bacterium]|jgi:hypothetical protein|nr:GspMb/PilO family protein [Candidatus Saccharibacteria bacterium]HMT55349.1 GspMb/PilO family protein [Candidatus Saccharibacteria bacterium]
MPSKVITSHKSVKHDAIDKSNNRTIIAVGTATFVFIFSAFAVRALISQSLYHGRVIREKELALSQLKENEQSIDELKKTYESFESEEINILTGNPAGNGALDGTNVKLVLDALPSKYDYPALSSSFEKILRDGGYDIGSIGGAEDSGLAESSAKAIKDVKPVEIPYVFSVNADTEGLVRLLETLEHSIRPMYVDQLEVQVGDTVLQAQVTLRTYFTQPKTFELGSKEIK